MVRSRTDSPINPATVSYLESIGLNPYRILQENVGEDGYDEFAVDKQGHVLLAYGMRPVVRHPWPQGFDWMKLVQCMRLDGIWPGGELR